MDWSLVHTLNGFLAAHDGIEDPIVAAIGAAEVTIAGLLVIAFLVLRAARRAVAAALGATALALLAGQIISHLVDRARPFVAHPHGVHLFSAHAADPGFPSDHATASFAIAVAIFLRHRRAGTPALVVAALISVARVAMGLHYPSDVVAGALLGSLAALTLWIPQIRRVLDALADAVGGVIDTAVGAIAGRRRHAAT